MNPESLQWLTEQAVTAMAFDGNKFPAKFHVWATVKPDGGHTVTYMASLDYYPRRRPCESDPLGSGRTAAEALANLRGEIEKREKDRREIARRAAEEAGFIVTDPVAPDPEATLDEFSAAVPIEMGEPIV